MNYERVTRKVLDNGLTVLIRENPGDPLAALQIWVKTGSINEDVREGSGISHYMEHMLFKGTAKYPTGEIARRVKSLGGQINAYTSYEYTVYHVTLPQANLEAVMEIMADAVFNSSFDPAECEREKQVIIKEINMNDDDPDRYLSRLFTANLYQRLPYRHPVIGYRQMFSAITREDLLDYHRSMYVPQNMVVVISGGADTARTLAEAEQLFAPYLRKPTPPLVVPDEPPVISPKRVEQEFPLKVSRLQMGFPTVSIHQSEMFPLDVLAILLGRGKSSRLYRRIKEEMGLVYTISSFSYTPNYQGFFGIDAELDYERLPQIENALWQEIKAIQQGSISQEEVDKAKNRLITDYLLQQESVESQARDLGSNETTLGDYKFSAYYLERIQQVTVAQVVDAANRFLQPNRQTLAILKPKQAEKAAGTQDSGLRTQDSGLQKQTLDNGLTILTQSRPQLPLAAIILMLKGGVYYETPQDNGIFNFIQHMLLKGTKNLSGEEIARKLETVGGRMDTSSGTNAVTCQILVQKKDLALGLELLADIVFNPGFPAGEMDKVRQEIIADINSQEDTPMGLGRKLFMKTFFAPHPYGLPPVGTREVISGLKREDLVQAHNRFYVPQNMILSVSGDVEAGQVRELAQKYFGGAKATPAAPPQIPAAQALNQIRQAEQPMEKTQTVLLLGYPGIRADHPDRYAFQVLAQILSGLSSRVVDNLRERRGLAYYAGAFQFAGLDTGAFVFYVGTTAEKLAEAKAGLLEEIGHMRQEAVSQEELERAQQAIIGREWIDRQSNSNIAQEAAADEITGLGYGEIYRLEQGIRKVTREDILRLAREYFTPDKYVVTVAGALLKP